jgi:hypothetical protein
MDHKAWMVSCVRGRAYIKRLMPTTPAVSISNRLRLTEEFLP